MDGETKSVRASSSEQSYDKSTDDDVDGDDNENDVDSGDVCQEAAKPSKHGRRKKRRGSKRLRRSTNARHATEKVGEGHSQRSKVTRKPRSTADSPTTGARKATKWQTTRDRLDNRSRPPSINGAADPDANRSRDMPTSDTSTNRGADSAASTNHVADGAASANHGAALRRVRTRSPPPVQRVKAAARVAPPGAVDVGRPGRKLSTVNSDMIDISSTEREVLSYIDARNRETIAALATSGGHIEQTFCRCMRLSSGVGRQVTANIGHQVTANIGHQVTANVGHQVTANVEHQVTANVEHQAVGTMGHQTTASVGHRAMADVGDQDTNNGNQSMANVGSGICTRTKRSVNLSTLSFDVSPPRNGAKSTGGARTFSLKYSRTPVPTYPAYGADMFMRNGVFDPVEYLVHNRVACRLKSLDVPRPDGEAADASGSFRDRNRRRPPKPILKACVDDDERHPGLLEAQSKSKCVRFACPEPERECC